MDLINGLKAFVTTAQTRSFTESANRLGISNRLTSKYVAELESRIGAKLLQRTTRKVGLTPTGQALLNRAPALLAELDDMLTAISEESQGLSGLLRITAPVTLGEIYLHEVLRRFALLHPDLTLDLRLNDSHVDLAMDGFDIAFRVGKPEVTTLKARKLLDLNSRLVASPDYLNNKGEPKSPAELKYHTCIIDTNRRDASRWTFTKNNQQQVIHPERKLLVNSANVARDWAIAGSGIALCPDFVLTTAISTGQLVPILGDFSSASHPLYVAYLDGNVLPRKVRALIDFAVAHITATAIFTGNFAKENSAIINPR